MKTTRNTTAKTAVLEVFEKSKTALSHTEIQKQLNDVCDRVTIYRILDDANIKKKRFIINYY